LSKDKKDTEIKEEKNEQPKENSEEKLEDIQSSPAKEEK